MERSHTRQTQAGCCKQSLGATRKAKNRRYRTTAGVERHGARLKTTSNSAPQPVRAQVACIVCFFHVKCCPVLGVCRHKSTARLLSALPRTDEGARAGASLAQACSSQSVSVVARKKKCAPRGASRKHRNALVVPVEDQSAGQPHPPSELVARRLPLDECEVLTGLNWSKCSLTFLGQVSVSGAQAGFAPSLSVGLITRAEMESSMFSKSLTFG